MSAAYAKINIGLMILGKRPDGYHDIQTVFHRIQVADHIRFEPCETIEVESDDSAAPAGSGNICYKAAMEIQAATGCRKGVRVVLQKNIPVGAGLGGGSADAAYVLRHLPAFWRQPMDENILRSIALRLGSDVPYFLLPGSAYAEGRGEILTPIDLSIPFTILLCNPNIHVSTAWAYSQIQPAESPSGTNLIEALRRGLSRPSILRDLVRNDFEQPVFRAYPAIREVKQTMLDGGAVFSLMSGSGSSVYGFFDDGVKAHIVEKGLTQQGYRVFQTPPGFSVPVS